MYDMFRVLLTCIAATILTLLLTPVVKRLAIKSNAIDKPNERRINKKPIPTLGGVAIFLSFFFCVFFLLPIPNKEIFPILASSLVVMATGIVDDIKELSPKGKAAGIIIAAVLLFFTSNIRMDMLSLPYFGNIYFGAFSLPLTIFWILAITNAVNLIDGLDGLASGVSMIALLTMGTIGYFFLTTDSITVPIMIFVLVGSIAGFLPYNFYPASIFLGDTGALFIGFMISLLSLQGLKNATLITFIIPIIILGIPITDTLYAIIRRKMNRQPISSADKLHIHHRLMTFGLTHRQTVLAIYCLAGIFSVIALLYPISTFWGSLLLTLGLLFGLELFVEIIGLTGPDRQPLLKQLRSFAKNLNRKR
ncbi:MAG: undecaprenyl/decaprenyl-phosphate alpha-N-acetylglucosaminyl 1-phosphate transferase [Pisciglobus halotolerans]|nr:undecaprenyl/decaprenyl-phosphate alpha-N-acetylglucosaminyl 1-phosphate transferase [Pisciglobus halotolerans]